MTEKLIHTSPTYREFWRNSLGMKGERAVNSRAERAINPINAMTAPVRTKGDNQPDRAPSVGIRTTPPTRSPRATPPTRSRLPPLRSSSLGKIFNPIGMVSAADAAATKIDFHPNDSASAPPRSGPIAPERPIVAAITPRTVPRDSGTIGPAGKRHAQTRYCGATDCLHNPCYKQQ